MKTRTNALFLLALLAAFACKEQSTEPEMEAHPAISSQQELFDKNVATIQAFFQAHMEEDLEAQRALLADTMRYSPPAYNGNHWEGKAELLEVLQAYHEHFDNIVWHEGIVMPAATAAAYWSGSVFPEGIATNHPGALRVYGTWTATHTESGKEVGVKFFSNMALNADGKIVQASDYFDVHGLQAQLLEGE